MGWFGVQLHEGDPPCDVMGGLIKYSGCDYNSVFEQWTKGIYDEIFANHIWKKIDEIQENYLEKYRDFSKYPKEYLNYHHLLLCDMMIKNNLLFKADVLKNGIQSLGELEQEDQRTNWRPGLIEARKNVWSSFRKRFQSCQLAYDLNESLQTKQGKLKHKI